MIFDVIPIGSRIIGGFIGRNKKNHVLFDNYSVNTYKTVHRTRLIGVFCWKLLE